MSEVDSRFFCITKSEGISDVHIEKACCCMVSQRCVYVFVVISCFINFLSLESAQAESPDNIQASVEMQQLNAASKTSLPTSESLSTTNIQTSVEMQSLDAASKTSLPTAPESFSVAEFSLISQNVLSQNVTPPPSQIVVPQPDEPKLPELLEPNGTPQPESPTKLPIADPAVSQKILNALILNALRNSAARYPWFINPTNSVSSAPTLFDPNQSENYSTLDIRSRGDRVIIENFDYSYFPKQQQFYWVLPGNRVVVETQGWQAGIRYQGQVSETRIERKIELTQGLWGLQTAWTIPQPFRDLIGNIDPKTLTIQSIAGEVVNPAGLTTGRIVLNTGVNDSNAIRIPTAPLKLGSGSTFSGTGGSALFQSLDPENTPLILQGFPTSNLQPLLEGEGLFVGAKVPKSALSQLGISWGDPNTGFGATAAPPLSSLPGIKIAQFGKFDNIDLLNILVNPSLSQAERDYHYLNSLYWISLGQRSPKIIDSSIETKDNYWQLFSFNLPHNRSLLQYDTTEAKATFSNVFANPGLAFSFSVDPGKVNDLQTFNSTFGLLLGGLFSFVTLPGLDEGLQEGKDRFKQQEAFANLETKATPEQRRQINQRLNRTLFFANRTTGLRDISGTVTFPSTITPDGSSVFQLRTGTARRLVRFVQVERRWIEGDTTLSRLRLSNEDFGLLTFLGAPIPTSETSLTASDRSFANQVVLEAPNGQRFFQEFNSQDFGQAESTIVPIPVRSFDMAFDLIELSQIGLDTTRVNRFDGYLFLPTVEGLWSGSQGKWSYTVNSGLWINFNGDSAFQVATNNRGMAEPTVGVYLNALVNHVDTQIKFDNNGKQRSLVTMIPSIRLSWNSAANPSTPAYASLSYLYSEQSSNLSYSLTPGLFIVADNTRVSPILFFQGQLGLRSGFGLNTSVELGDDSFYLVEATQRVNPFWTVGSYVQNYRSDSSWVGRLQDLSYGVLVRHQPVNRSMSWESRLGMSGDSFEVRLEGSFQF